MQGGGVALLSIKFCSKLSCWQGWLVHCLDNPERRTEAEKPSQRGGIANRKFFARIYKSPESLRAVWKVEGSHAMDGNLCQPRISKSDEFSEKFQTAFDPSPIIFGKLYCDFRDKIVDKSVYVLMEGLLRII